jgi:putative ABC transport system permease protein
MMPLLRMARRSLVRRWPQTLLSVIGIGLGIAVILAVDISNDSARRAFEYASESLGGQPEAVILGGAGGIGEEIYRDLRLRHGIRGITPVVEGRAEHPDSGTELRVIGIDPLSMGGRSGMGPPAPCVTWVSAPPASSRCGWGIVRSGWP